MGRLNTPDDLVGAEYVVGGSNKKYFVPTLARVDSEIADLTRRVGNYRRDDKFPDLVATLTADRDLLLERRMYLMMLAPVADLGGTDRGLVR
jgi:hypothetical protein